MKRLSEMLRNNVNKQILYISYDGLTDTLGQSQILPYIIGLSKFNYNFTIVSVEKRGKFFKFGKNIQKICNENNLDWHFIYYTKKPPIISTLFDIRKIKKIVFELQKHNRFDMVHCRSYIASLIGLKLKNKFGIPFLFDMRGFYADERVDGNVWILSKPHYKCVYKYFKKKEKLFLLNADAIVSLTEAGKHILINDWQVKPPVFVIPCAVDTQLFKPISIEKSKNLTIAYLGSIGTWYLLPEMLDFYKVLLETYPTTKFLFITSDKPQSILQMAEDKAIPTKYIEIKFSAHNDVPELLSQVDIGIFFIKPVFSKKASSPTKQGELMSMGIPVITNAGVGDTDKIIKKYKSGYLLNEFTPEDYRKAVSQINEILNFSKKEISEGAEQYFSLEKSIKKYKEIYTDLIEK